MSKPKTTGSPSKSAERQAAVPRRRRAASAQRPPGRSDDGNAFIPDPGEGPAHVPEELAEILAEDFLASATGGNDVLEEDLDTTLPDEVGGPFVLTRAGQEFADDVDASNPEGAEPEALPKPVAGLIQRPRPDDADIGPESDEEEQEEQEEKEKAGERSR